jgi:hypothetical protein
MNRAAFGLLLLGLLQMSGDVLEQLGLEVIGRPVKGIGAATTAAPAPKVFSAVRGLETFSTRFFLEWQDQDGRQNTLQITPEVYGRIKGPYNRRNVYGAVLAYGPVLATTERTQAMFEAVTHFALCGRRPLAQELGIEPASVAGAVRVRYVPVPGTNMDGLPDVVEVRCP